MRRSTRLYHGIRQYGTVKQTQKVLFNMYLGNVNEQKLTHELVEHRRHRVREYNEHILNPYKDYVERKKKRLDNILESLEIRNKNKDSDNFMDVRGFGVYLSKIKEEDMNTFKGV